MEMGRGEAGTSYGKKQEHQMGMGWGEVGRSYGDGAGNTIQLVFLEAYLSYAVG